MTAQLAAPAASGLVMMDEHEARVCLEKIRFSAIAFRDLLIDFEDREGWRALGYESWRACATDVFGKSTATVYRQLRAARFEREISHREKNSAPLPIRQADQLARLDTPDERREAYAEARFEGNGHATEATVAKAVDRRVGPKAPRPSVTSGAVATDCQDVDDDVLLAGNEVPEIAVNNEARRAGPSPLWCSFCSEYGHCVEDCPEVAPTVTPDRPGSASPSGESPLAVAANDAPPASEQPAAPATPETDSQESARRMGAVSDFSPKASQSADDTTPEGQLARYLDGIEAALALADLDMAAYMPLLSIAECGPMRRKHAVLRKWLADLDYQIFLAERRHDQGAA